MSALESSEPLANTAAVEKAKGMLAWFKNSAKDFDAKIEADLAGTQNTRFEAMNNFFSPIYSFVTGPLFDFVGEEGKEIRGKVDELYTITVIHKAARNAEPPREEEMKKAEDDFEKNLRQLEEIAENIVI